MEKINNNNENHCIYETLKALSKSVINSKETRKSAKNQETYNSFILAIFSGLRRPKISFEKLNKAAKFIVLMRSEALKNKNNEFIEVLQKWASEIRKNLNYFKKSK